MKIEQIIVLHLYIKKQVTLQGIGTFHLDPSVSLPTYNKAIILPENAITFEYDAIAAEDAALIDSIVHYTKKLRPLATADLESFLIWQKQLLNMNMPFDLQDIGMLQKTPQGQLKFIPYQRPAAKIYAIKLPQKNKKEAGPVLNKTNAVAIDYGKKILPFIIVLLGTIFIISAVYQFADNQISGTKIREQSIPTITANNKITIAKKDSLKSTLPIKTVNKQNVSNTYTFKVVFFETKNKDEALKTHDQAYGFGHSVIMYSKDSMYKVAIPFNRPLGDTSQIIDSLNQYYSLGKGYVDQNNF